LRTSQPIGLFYTLICGLLWSTAGVFIKLLPWHPLAIACVRSALAAGVLYAAMVLLQKRRRVLVNRQTVRSGVFLGLTMLLFVIANKMTTAANAIVLQSTATVFVILYGILVRKEHPPRRDLIATGCVFLGIVLFFLDSLSPRGLVGNLVALASAVTFAGVFLTSTDAKDDHTAISGLIVGQVFTAAVGLPFLLSTAPLLTPTTVGSSLFLGIFQLGVAYVLFSYGSQRCTPLAMALVAMVEPICSPVWVAIFAHEVPGPLALIGAAIVLGSLTVWSIVNARHHAA